MNLILASASPRRKELLSLLGYPFIVEVLNVDEQKFDNESVIEYVERLSKIKADAILRDRKDVIVLGADTIVSLKSHDLIGRVFGKPENREEAKSTLLSLSGRVHQVYTAVSLLSNSIESKTFTVKTDVEFRNISNLELESYLDCNEPYDKAGAYALQGIAAKFIREVKGSVSNVIGLPLCEVQEALSSLNVSF